MQRLSATSITAIATIAASATAIIATAVRRRQLHWLRNRRCACLVPAAAVVLSALAVRSQHPLHLPDHVWSMRTHSAAAIIRVGIATTISSSFATGCRYVLRDVQLLP